MVLAARKETYDRSSALPTIIVSASLSTGWTTKSKAVKASAT